MLKPFRPWLCLCVLVSASVLVIPTGHAGPLVAPSDPLTPQEQLKKFKLPPGFEIQLVASEPDIQKPMNLNFDAKGRLWVTHSTEYPFPATDPEQARDGVTILDGIGADGKATKISRFADKLNIPIGVLPLKGGREAIVWSIPNIWKLSDTDGDGKADQREILYGPFDCVDTHGDQNAFRLGLDGWVYACHGFRNHSKIKLKGEGSVVLEMQSGNTYRFKPDGSAIEQCTWGQVNPFGMCFDPLSNIYTADCHSKPITMLLRGGYYESFGKPHDGLGFAPAMTGHDHGSTGIAGVAYYGADQFPKEYRDCFYVCNVVNNCVHRDVPQWRGSSPWIDKPQDFVTCDDFWFHPVDIQLGPDGALYIADFYNCIIGHYEVDLKHPRRDRFRGRIWRVVWKGTDGKAEAPKPPADLTTLSAEQLVGKLDDPNLIVRTRAANELAERFGKEALTAVDNGNRSPHQQAYGIWLRYRAGTLDRADLKELAKGEPIVRVHLLRALAELKAWEPLHAELVRGLLSDSEAQVRRVAAEALGLHPDLANVKPLLQLWAATPAEDTHLIHTIRIALRNQLKDRSIIEKLAELKLEPNELTRLVEIGLAVPSEQAAAFTFEHVRRHEPAADLTARCMTHVGRYAEEKRLDDVAAFAQNKFADDLGRQAALLQALRTGLNQRGLRLTPDSPVGKWATSLAATLLDKSKQPKPAELVLAIQVAEQMRLGALSPRIIKLAEDGKTDIQVRTAAAQATLSLDPAVATKLLLQIVKDSKEPLPLRGSVAQLLGSLNTPETRAALVAALTDAPASLQQPLALALVTTVEGADALFTAIAAGKASGRLLQDRPVLERLQRVNLPDKDKRITELTKGLPAAEERLRKFVDQRLTGYAKNERSAEKGAVVFKAQCAACHRIGAEGSMIGPHLNGIGSRGLERLLEDMLDPNRNVDAAFRTTVLTTKKGIPISGLRLRQEGKEIVLADAQGKEVRVNSDDVEDMQQVLLSPMPANLVESIKEEDFHDLMAFLLAQRATTAEPSPK